MGYSVVVNGEVEKTYPFKLQAIIHCYEKGYVWTCRQYGDNLYEQDIRIVREDLVE